VERERESGSDEPGDGVAEDLESIRGFLKSIPGPGRVLGGEHESFGVGHQPENLSGDIAQPSEVQFGPIGVVRLGGVVIGSGAEAKNRLARLSDPFPNPDFPDHEPSFAMGNWKGESVDRRQKGAVGGECPEVDPGIQVPPSHILGEGGDGALLIVGKEEAGFQKDLESVADSQNQLSLVPKFSQGVSQEVMQLQSEQSSGPRVIAVGEAARDDEDLEVFEEIGVSAQFTDMDTLGLGPCEGERVGGFLVTIGAWGAQNKNTGFHGEPLNFGRRQIF